MGVFRPAGALAATLTVSGEGHLKGTGVWIVDQVGRTFHFDAIDHPASKSAKAIAIVREGQIDDAAEAAGYKIAAVGTGGWTVTAGLACLAAVDRVEAELAALMEAAQSWRRRLLEPSRIVNPVDHVAAAPVLVSFDQTMQPDLATIDAPSAFHRLTSFAALARHALRASDPASFEELISAPEATVDATEAWLRTWTVAFSANGVLDRLLITGNKLNAEVNKSRRGLRGQVRCVFSLGHPQPAKVRLSFSSRPPPVQWGFDDAALQPLRESSRVSGSPDEWLYDLPVEGRAKSLVVIGPEDTRVEGRSG
ncbi:hypothetical protein [Bradyrhizobium sp. sGM-13]|uniref:hypothetical protein n=1 Tax=Bradyrhizobium sp. sGM-13 TaxID=2831781 RepID=UPI001BD0B506|nr:hypothetical protein [Bradyrhizobium sp. sGM-13]